MNRLRNPKSNKKWIYVAGTLSIIAVFGSLPLVIRARRKDSENMMFREEPLTGSQIMRGAYINSGSKDVGRDPDWDPVTRTHRSKTPSTFNPSEEQVEEWSKRFESKEGGQKEGEHEGRE